MLERRDVPSSLSGVTVFTDTEPNDVITAPQQLGAIDPGQVAQVYGAIGNNAYGGADVDWYGVDVYQTEQLTLTLNGTGVVSLYNNDPAAVPLAHQLILQFNAAGPATAQSINLLPGSYEIAVSGAGDRYFSPVLAGSGTIGGTGSYILSVAGAKADFDPTAPLPIVRTDIPAGGYAGSPLAINVILTQPIDLTQDYITILDAYQDDLMPNVSLDANTNDLVIAPVGGLVAGRYQIVAYDADGNQLVALPFTVNGTATTDTLATAAPLGNITNAGLVQLPGVIGNDPYYSPLNFDQTATNPASQVNMYTFTISGPGVHVLTAEAFASRIGSTLNPALTLFRITGRNKDGTPAWQLVGGNDNSYNPTLGSDGEMALYSDPVLFTGLTPGRYVIAVSTTANYADPLLGMQLGVNGVFDPNRSHSAWEGQTTGNYVLNLFVQPGATAPPQVTQISLAPGTVVDGPPSQQIEVQFSAVMNLVQLAVASGQQWGAATAAGSVDPALLQRFPCFVTDAVGNCYFLALTSYDAQTSTADFSFLQRLTTGQYYLHLSGPNGLTDLTGNPLAGNSVSGDYIVPFSVTDSPARPATITLTNADDSVTAPTDLGALFPEELGAGVSVQRDFRSADPAPTDEADYYRFTLMQDTTVALSLGGDGLNVAGRPVLLDANGNPLYPAVNPGDPGARSMTLLLHAGTYTVMVGSWLSGQAGQAVYTLTIRSVGLPENPTPLTSGPAPAYRLQLDTVAPPAGPASVGAPTPPPSITFPGQGTSGILLTLDRSAAGALAGGSTLAGAASGLAVGPVGVVGSSSASSNDTVRLVLPGTEFPSTGPVAIADGATSVAAAPAGVYFGPLESALQILFLFTFDWMKMSPLIPPSLLHEGVPAPADEAADPEDADESALLDGAAAAAALALVGVRLDGEERKKRPASW